MTVVTLFFYISTVLLGAGVVVLAVLYHGKRKAYEEIYARTKGIVDVEQETRRAREEYAKVLNESTRETQKLRDDYRVKRAIYDGLVVEIGLLEENLEDISYGLYKPHFDYDTSEAYKERLNEIRDEQKRMLRGKSAATCPKEWTVEGSKAEGKRMVDRNTKLMLRAFNGECDAAASKVSWNNVQRMLERIERAFDSINKLGEPLGISISRAFLHLKEMELRLVHEHEDKRHAEREEQKRIRQEMREEEKARRECEKAQQDAEEEETRYQEALERARAELASAMGQDVADENEKIALLEQQLKEAQERKERAISQAQLTRSGHVYIISNIGSFGDRVYKIGLTRRLEPLDRVKELGDASVPFPFDVHAMIYSKDAPTLESRLHRYFEGRRLNLVNGRKEFFRAKLNEIERVVKALGERIEFTRIVEAREYRETLAIRKVAKEEPVEEEQQTEPAKAFPASL